MHGRLVGEKCRQPRLILMKFVILTKNRQSDTGEFEIHEFENLAERCSEAGITCRNGISRAVGYGFHGQTGTVFMVRQVREGWRLSLIHI